ncbi:MAG: putative transposase for insertion sequence element [Frankiales bacterium]|nr:putative transposase for insertion sequence element [Frankiales bacterium]
MSKQEFSIPKLALELKSELDAYVLLEDLRWGTEGPEACPKCGAVGRQYFLNPANGASRKTRTGNASERRVWKCGHCRKQYSVLTDTIFHGTKISIRTWLLVIFEVCSSKNSVSAWEISRKYEITNESAWHMLHRIREAMKMEPLAGLLGGAVQVDETWIGGEPKNWHKSDPRQAGRKQGPTDKQPVVSLVHYETRAAHSRVVADVTAKTLMPAIEEVMDLKRTHLHTDGGAAYKTIAPHVAAHETVDHSVGQYTDGNVSTNLNEGYFSQLKRSLDGTHHHVSTEHLQRYLNQFDFMYTHCKATDSQRMRTLIGNVEGRRLQYKAPVAEVDF